MDGRSGVPPPQEQQRGSIQVEAVDAPALAKHDSSVLDLAFVLDCTSSMASFIHTAQQVRLISPANSIRITMLPYMTTVGYENVDNLQRYICIFRSIIRPTVKLRLPQDCIQLHMGCAIPSKIAFPLIDTILIFDKKYTFGVIIWSFVTLAGVHLCHWNQWAREIPICRAIRRQPQPPRNNVQRVDSGNTADNR